MGISRKKARKRPRQGRETTIMNDRLDDVVVEIC